MPDDMRFPFTKTRLAKIPFPAAGRVVYHDADCPNLILIVSPRSKGFAFYGRLGGRPSRLTLGKFPTMTVEQARTACRRMIGAKADGRDPAAERQARRQEPTLQALFDRWLEGAKLRKRTWRDDVRQFEKYLAPLRNLKLSAIRGPRVSAWHNKLGSDHGKVQANRCLFLLSTLFNAGHLVGFMGPNPCKLVARFPEQSRERFLLPDEMQAFLRAVLAEEPVWRDVFLLCLFTGARRGNVASMTWDEVDLTSAVWTIPGEKTKNKKPATVALSRPALAVLQARRLTANGSQWVFPSDRGDGPVVDPRKAWERVLAASGIKNLRMHDLRRSLGSWQAALGASLPVIGQSLTHADLKSTQVYARLQLDTVRQSVEAATDAMLRAGGIKLLEGEINDGAA